MIKLVENTAVVVAVSILIVGGLMAVAVLFLCALFVTVVRKLKPRRVQRTRPPVLNEISKMSDYARRCKTRPQCGRVSGALRRRKSKPLPDLVFVSYCADGMVHGTPEGLGISQFQVE